MTAFTRRNGTISRAVITAAQTAYRGSRTIGTMTSGFALLHAEGMSPQGANTVRTKAPGLWVHRYWTGLSFPLTSIAQGVNIPAAARMNPTTSRITARIEESPNRPTKSE